MNKAIKMFLSDGKGNLSSKRLVGIIASLALIAFMFINPSTEANNSVLILAVSGLGLTTVEKVFSKKEDSPSSDKTDKQIL